MKKLAFLVALLAAVSFAHAQKPFFGTIDFQFSIEGPNADMMSFMMPEKMVIQYAKKGMKMYFMGGMMADMMGKIVLDGKTNRIFQVKEDEQTVYILGPEDMMGSDVAAPDQVVKEEEVIVISGYTCQKYKTVKVAEDGSESVTYIWTTEALKTPKVSTPEMQAKAGMNLGANGVPGFPLKSVTTDPSTGLTITLMAINIDNTKLSNKEFGVPKGYAVADFEMPTGE